jgi:hypothetical protein
MPKIDNNPIMKGVSGMLGGVVVYRQFRGMTIMSNRPRKARVITPHQQAIKSRFLLAVEYAKKQIADPVLKAKYEPGPDSEFTSAYIAAVADYLRTAKQNNIEMEKKGVIAIRPITTAILNDTSVDNFSQGATNLLQVSTVFLQTSEPFSRCFNGIFRAREPTHVTP